MEFKHPKYYAEMRKLARAQALKPTSPQAKRCRNQGHKLRAQASSLSQQAQGSGSQGTSVQPDPGHKQPE